MPYELLPTSLPRKPVKRLFIRGFQRSGKRSLMNMKPYPRRDLPPMNSMINWHILGLRLFLEWENQQDILEKITTQYVYSLTQLDNPL